MLKSIFPHEVHVGKSIVGLVLYFYGLRQKILVLPKGGGLTKK
jgi:hypothetical protein